ncbi:hypothetical protein PTTG_27235 [Puccinia triticina 1-1 BBBD Race 1]|uniref:Uncharacterized protein n=2 Tax=Puccinia triticina TaxID=208348 RepID=A0A180GNW6_PUCT1|nr:hypothetical protein PTTG_27235 [Puccinia triticina 1-1 BBBD Race 1]
MRDICGPAESGRLSCEEPQVRRSGGQDLWCDLSMSSRIKRPEHMRQTLFAQVDHRPNTDLHRLSETTKDHSHADLGAQQQTRYHRPGLVECLHSSPSVARSVRSPDGHGGKREWPSTHADCNLNCGPETQESATTVPLACFQDPSSKPQLKNEKQRSDLLGNFLESSYMEEAMGEGSGKRGGKVPCQALRSDAKKRIGGSMANSRIGKAPDANVVGPLVKKPRIISEVGAQNSDHDNIYWEQAKIERQSMGQSRELRGLVIIRAHQQL